MNKHLNDWLDKVEGRQEGSSNKAIAKELKLQGYNAKELEQFNKEQPEEYRYKNIKI